MNQYIIVDDDDGQPNAAQVATGAGVIGHMARGNVNLTAYPKVLGRPIDDLAVGESTKVEYSLSGSKGLYHVVRVK